MVPAKKSAKKVVKKAAKKAGKKAAKHHAGEDLRHAYEHMGRLKALQERLPGTTVKQIQILLDLAQTSLEAGDRKSAADLLRGGEHLAFASLAGKGKEAGLGEELIEAIHGEYEHLVEKAEEHWERHEENRPLQIEEIYTSMRHGAEVGLGKGAFRRALELARGAEALAHVQRQKPMLEGGRGNGDARPVGAGRAQARTTLPSNSQAGR